MQKYLLSGPRSQNKNLISGIVLIALTACGGQPELQETQAVVQSPAPEVELNSAAEIAWRASSSGGKLGAVQFEPVVKDNTVYTASRKGSIEGFDLDTGRLAFSKTVRGELANGVGVNATSIIAVTDDGEVVALDRDDGSEKWRNDIGRSISAAPALNDQIVVVRTVDGHMVAINAVTGEQTWVIERPVASLSVGLDAPGLVAGEGLISGFSSGRVVASNIYNGTTFWEKRAFRPGGKNEIERLIDIDAPPVLAGQLVLLGAYRGGIVAYQLRNGEEVWRNEGVATRKPMAVSAPFLGVTGPESEVALIDLRSGDTLWKRTQLRGNGLSSPVIVDESVIVGNLDGNLYFLGLSDGIINSRFNVGTGPITSLLKVDQGVLIYSAGSGKLTLIKGSL